MRACVSARVCVWGSILLYIGRKSILAGVWWLLYFREAQGVQHSQIYPGFINYITICFLHLNSSNRHSTAAALILPHLSNHSTPPTYHIFLATWREIFTLHRNMLIDGEKYACDACVRGHRVSNCQHSGKFLTVRR